MKILGIYAALATANMQKSEAFYTHLFKRPPDDRPMGSLIQWRDVSGANIQIFADEKNAGSARLTIVVANMEEARKMMDTVGVSLLDESQGDYGKIAQISDPDGDRITLAEPPLRAVEK